MKKGLVSGLVLLVLGLVCGVILAGVNSITAPVIAENEYRAKLEILGEFYNVDDYIVELVELEGAIDSVFLLKNKTSQALEKAVYSVRAYGYQSDIVMLISINADMTVDQYKVVSQGETSGIGDVIVGYDFQMGGENIANLDAFAGPTASYSSNAVKTCFQLVGVRALIDFADLIVPVDLTVDSLSYNLDNAGFLTKPFIATITYGETDIQTQVYLAINFDFVAMVNPTDPIPGDDVLAELKLRAQQVLSVSNKTFVSAYDSTTHTVTVSTVGMYANSPIRISFVLNETEDAIVSATVVSDETYHESEEYLAGYGNPPGVENHLIDVFEGGSMPDAVAGATVTSNAVLKALALIQQYLNRGGE
jgi:electron transport complex protein RnfG